MLLWRQRCVGCRDCCCVVASVTPLLLPWLRDTSWYAPNATPARLLELVDNSFFPRNSCTPPANGPLLSRPYIMSHALHWLLVVAPHCERHTRRRDRAQVFASLSFMVAAHSMLSCIRPRYVSCRRVQPFVARCHDEDGAGDHCCRCDEWQGHCLLIFYLVILCCCSR